LCLSRSSSQTTGIDYQVNDLIIRHMILNDFSNTMVCSKDPIAYRFYSLNDLLHFMNSEDSLKRISISFKKGFGGSVFYYQKVSRLKV
jgi:hypothetical protein